ncbi:hypothetical protein L1281_000720 [Neisseria sp. HSC-16F19]|nr:hypothetical protein [Neisseria sp. HSC-16F19]MCP2040140.1 hypothetical protein [Neisseria sp. HSC-16F19]
MAHIHSAYRVFFWKFGLLMPLLSALLMAVITLLFYVHYTASAMVFGVAVMAWLSGLPLSLLIAWLVCRRQWLGNVRGCLSTALLAGILTLLYEVLVMAVTDVLTGQVGSFFHIEVVHIALYVAVVSGLCAWRWLPKH